ncbi:NAD(P)/FAD-dependent oxidoreductase [Celeribacter halophilus]|uniref:NAD(P)/FAD-dependent oxidoreductase n=1 Tax=Celeribacter halophilus TaxID=576117 RepID=UPI003A8FC0E0
MNHSTLGVAPTPYSIAIVGAGIVGCSIALTLSAQGHKVTVFDPDAPGSGASSGNAGAIVTGSVTPVATPGVLRALPGYLFNKNAPAVLRLAHLPRAMPWLLNFTRMGTRKEVDRISAALKPLVSTALDAYDPLVRLSNSQDQITQSGWLKVFASDAEFAGTKLERTLLDRAEVSYDILDQHALSDLEPELAPEVCKVGLLQSQSGHVRNPQGLAQSFMETAAKHGARHLRQHVSGVRPHDRAGIYVSADGETTNFDKVVVTSGAWSGALVHQIGDRVLLDSERGYHIAFSQGSDGLLGRPVAFPAKGMVLSPMAGGMRMLNGSELAGLNAAPNFQRIRNLTEKAHAALPALKDQTQVSEWMGHRPSTPDSLPVIGPSPRCPNVLYAFGHGHLGLTLAAQTAAMIAEVIQNGTTPTSHTPYLIDRFSRIARPAASQDSRTTQSSPSHPV